MTQRIAIDTNAAVDYLRPNRPQPELIDRAAIVFLPLHVVGELFAGAFASRQVAENTQKIEELLRRWRSLDPTDETARIYGELRARPGAQLVSPSKLNDLWIAALCLQHNLPLLTNDRGFDHIAGLTVVHW
jgi:tRNA(fMet)-specific endonuclease VapC